MMEKVPIDLVPPTIVLTIPSPELELSERTGTQCSASSMHGDFDSITSAVILRSGFITAKVNEEEVAADDIGGQLIKPIPGSTQGGSWTVLRRCFTWSHQDCNLRAHDEARGNCTVCENITQPKPSSSMTYVTVFGKHPDRDIAEARDLPGVHLVRELDRRIISSASPGAGKSARGGEAQHGLDRIVLNDSIPLIHICTNPAQILNADAQSQSSISLSPSTRQTRVDESRGIIYRLMPPTRTIHFTIDADSFTRNNVPAEVVECIKKAAMEVVNSINGGNLGIAFAYTPPVNPYVFAIRYEPDLHDAILAQSFFPKDARVTWRVGISKSVALSGHGPCGYLDYMANILAHEFGHILGLRHWNAFYDRNEITEPSFLWPGTYDGNRKSVMDTGVHPDCLWFSEEDFRVIRQLYSSTHGTVLGGGRRIMDADPYDGHWP